MLLDFLYWKYLCQVTEALDGIQRQLRDQQGSNQALKGNLTQTNPKNIHELLWSYSQAWSSIWEETQEVRSTDDSRVVNAKYTPSFRGRCFGVRIGRRIALP